MKPYLNLFAGASANAERRYQLIERKRTWWFIINKHVGYSKHNTQRNSPNPGERWEVEKELRRRRRKKRVLICPLADEQSPCGWRELSKATKWIIIYELDWRQTLNENDVNLADLRGLRERVRATDREKAGSKQTYSALKWMARAL